MPPRARKTAAGPGAKRGGRPIRGASRVQPLPAEEPLKTVKVEEEEKPSPGSKMEPKVEEKPLAVKEKSVTPPKIEPEMEKREVEKKHENRSGPGKKDEVKESVDEYEKDERLDLEDNEPEYETEEYTAVDYDERGTDQEDIEEECVEVVEELEEGDFGEEEDGDMGEEEVEDVHDSHEDVEVEEDNDHHAEMVDAAEEEEHHEIVKERMKRKEFEIFVGGLDKDATEDDLKKVFSQVGEVTEVRLMMNPQTKKNKGFAFLRFATVEQARRACKEMKLPVVNGKQCGVTPSQDSDTLFLGNICKTWTEKALKDKLKHYGVENINDLTLVEDTNNVGMNRGFAFLEFSSRSDAMDAFKCLQKRNVVFGVDKPAKVSFSDSFIDPGDKIMAQVKTVFVDGLSASWDENHVHNLLKKYGKIEKIELACNMPSAKRKDFGFVTFDSHDAAVTCAKMINNEELGEGDNKAKVRARLSRPLSRARGKYGGRGDVRHRHGPVRVPRAPWGRPVPPSLPVRRPRTGMRVQPVVDRSFRRPVGYRDSRPVMTIPPRSRPVAPPLARRSYNRRQPAPVYPKNSFKRDYERREELAPPRSRDSTAYAHRLSSDKRTLYREEYSSRGPSYPDLPIETSRTSARRAYVDDNYGPVIERQPPAYYREGRGHEYESISGSKRSYSALDDVPPRYDDPGVRHSRARLSYDVAGGNASQYGDAYGDSRLGRSNLGYSGSRSSISSQDSRGLYNSRHGMGYSGGSYSRSDAGGVYSSGYGGNYVSRGGDVGGSSYSSLYSSRGMGGSGYMGSGGSGSYY
ncbi:PREDICTED: nucleolin-like isoform X4 [Ipomoea nil]|uniref:nucleolin-like isoform X4 n=1 Tax=Ipomoea nil TaxID=35883 RepID=UPI000901BEF4|nr:PREDICTED: nucleolin-like isoform X4 [Ipomoea nil]